MAMVAWAAIGLCGCAALPDARQLRAERLHYRTTPGAPPVEDGRGLFRQVFCAELRGTGVAASDDAYCDRWLWRLPDEPVARDTPPLEPLQPAGLAVFLVTGAFAECTGEAAWPYVAGAERLRAAGALVETITVSGRSGTASNARQIAEAIKRARVPSGRQLIVVGYSKGTLDTLRFLVDFPGMAGYVDAVVGVAGPIYGSPLADLAGPAYSALLAKVPYSGCEPGDGGVLDSLRPEAASEWIAANPLPSHVRYYSLMGFTTRKHVARVLVPSWKILNRTDVRNDGQVIAADAVIPGSTVLGLANADHWGIAETVETVRTFFASRPDPTQFPLEQLFMAMIRYVSGDLDSSQP